MPKLWIAKEEPFNPINIEVVEEMYKAKYLGYFPAPVSGGGWSADVAIDCFYQPNPDISKGHSEYFGIYLGLFDKKLMITNAIKTFAQPMKAALAWVTGEVLISRFRHDYRKSAGGTVFIDGGFDYVRSNGRLIDVVVEKGEFFALPREGLLEEKTKIELMDIPLDNPWENHVEIVPKDVMKEI